MSRRHGSPPPSHRPRRRGREWRPNPSPYSISDAEARRGRELMAADVCSCGHTRADHPTNSHGVIRTGCGVRGCRCQDYGRRKEEFE